MLISCALTDDSPTAHLPCKQDCGHDPVNDEALFSAALTGPSALPGELAGRAGGATGLAYDERMTLHCEDADSPHPERPDRIRAVLARLLSSGLAGVRPRCWGLIAMTSLLGWSRHST